MSITLKILAVIAALAVIEGIACWLLTKRCASQKKKISQLEKASEKQERMYNEFEKISRKAESSKKSVAGNNDSVSRLDNAVNILRNNSDSRKEPS